MPTNSQPNRELKSVTCALLASVVVFSSIGAAMNSNQGDAQTPGQSPASVEVPIELFASRPLTRITVNGQGPFAFLIDPQAQRTLIDPSLVEMLKLKPRASSSGGLEVEADFVLGSSKIPSLSVEVSNTGRFVPELGPAARPHGVLSPLLWKDHLVTIDFARWRLRIEPGALPEPNDKDVFALRAPSHELLVWLTAGERSLWCRIDPLFPRGLLLPTPYLEQLPLQWKPLDVGSTNTRQATVAVREARLATKVTLATFDFDAPIVLFGDVGEIAICGTPWLSGFSITYDMTNARARLERLRAP